MNKYLALAYTFLLLLLTSQRAHAQHQSTKALDQKYGFREMHFEADTTEFTDLVFSGKDKDTRLYTRRNDFDKVGEALVDKIEYAFYNGKLLRVTVKAKGASNLTALYEALQAQYGKGAYLPNHIKAYTWASKRVAVVYDENTISNTASMITWSKVLEAQRQQAEARAAKEASQGL